MKCSRCGKDTSVHVMSVFNTDLLCMKCKEDERVHPMYREACRAENDAVRDGNFNFEGIGKPADL